MHGTNDASYGDSTVGDSSLSMATSINNMYIGRIIQFNEFDLKIMVCVKVHEVAVGTWINQSWDGRGFI